MIGLTRLWVIALAWRRPPGIRRTYVVHPSGDLVVILDIDEGREKRWVEIPPGMRLTQALRALDAQAGELVALQEAPAIALRFDTAEEGAPEREES